MEDFEERALDLAPHKPLSEPPERYPPVHSVRHADRNWGPPPIPCHRYLQETRRVSGP
jgi:hypothetical protein